MTLCPMSVSSRPTRLPDRCDLRQAKGLCLCGQQKVEVPSGHGYVVLASRHPEPKLTISAGLLLSMLELCASGTSALRYMPSVGSKLSSAGPVLCCSQLLGMWSTECKLWRRAQAKGGSAKGDSA